MGLTQKNAIFLDRDGVLIEDKNLITCIEEIIVFPEVPKALKILHELGYLLIVVSNQTVVSRGLLSEKEVITLQDYITEKVQELGGAKLDGFYFCPHHPKASLVEYKQNCQCRKPRSGMLLQAANEWGIDFSQSYMIGDRITDIIAGKNVGCKTILVETGRHTDQVIEVPDVIDVSTLPDYRCKNLREAVDWIQIQ